MVAGAGGGGGFSEHLRNTGVERAAQGSSDRSWRRAEKNPTLCKHGDDGVPIKKYRVFTPISSL